MVKWSDELDAGLLTLQIPQATVHSSVVDDPWFAWHSMPVLRAVSLDMWEGELIEPTQVHDVVPANSTVVDDDIPSPQGNSIPLHIKLLVS